MFLPAVISVMSSPWWPFAVLGICVAFVVVGIAVIRLHAFLALILAALLAGLLAGDLPGKPEAGKAMRAVSLTISEFGSTAGNIAIVIAMATLIGMSMMESGAADKVVRRFLAVFGEKRAGLALLTATYFLSIPIFFDTMFMLMVPIAMVIALRTGATFTLYALAVCAGGVVTHSMTVPHPGPMFMVENLSIDPGLSLYAAILVGAVPVILSWPVIRWISARNPIPVRETPNAPVADVRRTMERPETELPSFLASVTPVIVPIVLIGLASFLQMARLGAGRGDSWTAFAGSPGAEAAWFSAVYPWVEFFGNKHIALMIGAGIALLLLARQKRLSAARMSELMGPPLETAGVIILITAAGGAFGLMLRNAGVGEAIQYAMEGRSFNLLFLGWLVALIIRVAQGSATVAMQATSAMLAPMMGTLTCHPMYLFLAIGFGSFALSWMNDSGFWVVSRLSGMTERETLRTWTVLVSALSAMGIILTLILAAVLPFTG